MFPSAVKYIGQYPVQFTVYIAAIAQVIVSIYLASHCSNETTRHKTKNWEIIHSISPIVLI